MELEAADLYFRMSTCPTSTHQNWCMIKCLAISQIWQQLEPCTGLMMAVLYKLFPELPKLQYLILPAKIITNPETVQRFSKRIQFLPKSLMIFGIFLHWISAFTSVNRWWEHIGYCFSLMVQIAYWTMEWCKTVFSVLAHAIYE